MEYTEKETFEQRVRNAMMKINSMSVCELLDVNFMIENTDYDSLDEMIGLAGTSDFNSPEWEDAIFQYTTFLCWKDMLGKARNDMLHRLL